MVALHAAKLFATIKNVGPFITQHFIWTLVLLSLLEEPTAGTLDWQRIKIMISQQNTLALFRRFLASFAVAPKRARDSVDEPMDDAHEDLDIWGGRRAPVL